MKASELSKSAQNRIKQTKGKIVIARQRGTAGHELIFVSPHNLGEAKLNAFERLVNSNWKIVERDV